MYSLRYTPCAEKYFNKLKEKGLIEAYNDALDAIESNPYAGKLKTGDLAGIYGWDVYYNAVNYELAYRILEVDEQYVVIILAGTRENFYKELKRYMSI